MDDKTGRRLPDPIEEPTITVARAGAVLGISRAHAYACVKKGEIPSLPVGGRVVVPTARFLAQFGLDTRQAEAA